jgi:hypothetical protein
VPKELIGSEVVMVPKSELVCISWAARGKPNPPGIVVDRSQFVANALNEHGEQMVLVSPRRDAKPTLYHEDLSWVPLDLMNAAGDLVVIRRDSQEDVLLSPAEIAWLQGCLVLLGLSGVGGLPRWKKGESVVEQLGRALATGDRKKQIMLLEKALAELRAKK